MKQILILLTLLFSFENVSGQEEVDVFNTIDSVNKKLMMVGRYIGKFLIAIYQLTKTNTYLHKSLLVV
jgi:hypothetical protein